MKRILPIFLCVVLLVGVFVLPASAIDNTNGKYEALLDGEPYEFWEGYRYSPYFYDSSDDITGEHLLFYLYDNDLEAVISYTSTNGAYLYISPTIVGHGDSSGYSARVGPPYTQYYYQNGRWDFVKTYSGNLPEDIPQTRLKWASTDINFTYGNGKVVSIIAGDVNFMNFHRAPLAEQIQGVAEEHLTEETLPALVETILTILTIAVGCLALVISLVVLVRVLRTVLPR